LLAACASAGTSLPAGEVFGAATPEAAVRGFLDAAQVEDYGTMGHLFGTAEGPAQVKFGVAEVEQRMIVMSALLKHRSYTLRIRNLSQLGPDRVRFLVELDGSRKGSVTLPVITIPAQDGRWYVEQLDLTPVSSSSIR